MPVLKILDKFLLTGSQVRNFSCKYSQDDRILISTDIGIYVIYIKANLNSSFKYLSCKKTFLELSNYAPCANISLDVNNFVFNLDREKLYETFLRSEFSSNINFAKSISPSCLCAKWSPKGIVNKCECLLGIVTNLYGLELYIRHIDENNFEKYVSVCNVVDCLISIEKQSWKNALRCPGNDVKLNEYTRRVEKVAATCFAWTHVYDVDKKWFVGICVGHFNGSLTFYKIENIESNCTEKCDIKYMGRYQTQLKQITKMYWHRTTKYGGGICIGDIEGKMSIINVKELNNDGVFADKETAFYTEVDRVIDMIKVILIDEYTVILVVKQNIIVFYLLNNVGHAIDYFIYDAKNFYITALEYKEPFLYVLTLNGSLKELNISIVNKKIKVETKIIPIKFDSTQFRTHGLFISTNNIIFGIIAYPCRIFKKNEMKTYVTLYYNSDLNPFQMLMENKSENIRHCYDIFEVLRLTCLTEYKFPWIGIDPNLNYDNLNLLQLKTLRHISNLSETVFPFVPNIPKYDIKPFVILQHLFETKLIIKRLNTLIKNTKNLTQFQLQSIDLQLFFLKDIIVRNILSKANVGLAFLNEIFNTISVANEIRFPEPPHCFWCGEKLIGTLCVPPHQDSRCCYSFMQTNFEVGYFCVRCSAVAHYEIEKEFEVVFCPYCDVPMTKMKKMLEESRDVNVCYEDCLKDFQNFDNIEENTREYVVVSSDSENESSDNNISSLYLKINNMSIEDLKKFDTNISGSKNVYKSDLVDERPTKLCKNEN